MLSMMLLLAVKCINIYQTGIELCTCFRVCWPLRKTANMDDPLVKCNFQTGIVPALTRSEMFEKNVEQNKMYDGR